MALVEKKGGPDTKIEQRKRREEVYKLHFEYGYSARKISEILKKNRGTINRDIMYLYTNSEKKWRCLDLTSLVMNQIERLNVQRTRRRKQLDNVESFKEIETIEKSIFNIDVKIANFQIRLVEARGSIEKEIANRINMLYEKEKSEKRVISPDIFLEVSNKANEKIQKIYREDMKF